jgi:hypothetical protein
MWPTNATLIAKKIVLSVLATAFAAGSVPAAVADATDVEPEPPRRLAPDRPLRLYDMRVLQAAPGKLDALHARIRDHQIPLLEQHGVFTQGVLVPAGENPNQLVYLLTAAEESVPLARGWADLQADPKWLAVVAETDKNGKLVAQVGYQRLRTTYWSPEFKPDKSAKPRVFELRTYTCPDHGKRSALSRRFRDHTMKLFEKHRMQNIVYWFPDEGEPEARQKLVYLLAHDSRDAAKKSFEAFRKDPDWLAAKKASEEAAGGTLTNPEKGVVSEFFAATEYSPLW